MVKILSAACADTIMEESLQIAIAQALVQVNMPISAACAEAIMEQLQIAIIEKIQKLILESVK